MRRGIVFTVLCLALAAFAPPAEARDAGFAAWLEQTVWPDARNEGVSRATFEAATKGLAPDRSLPGLRQPGTSGAPQVQWQAEFSSPARYFSENQLAPLERIGRGLLREWGNTLGAIERRYGVPKEIVVAVWGRESAFGRAALPKSAVRTLATLAYTGYRSDLFYAEFIAALKIVEADHIPVSAMNSSLAGALGQPQFLPTKYLSHAVDFDGDGKRDIWRSVSDTLASIAHYLKDHGWDPSAHWGVEADVPPSVSCALEGPEQGRPLADWRQRGVTRSGGGALPGDAQSTHYLMMPAGRLGPAFIVSKNFYVLKEYNESDLYALFIGHLADRLAGDARIRGGWRTVAGFARGDVRAMQQRLVAKGHDVGGADGLVGFKTRTAIGRWQHQNGRAATCFPDENLIHAIR